MEMQHYNMIGAVVKGDYECGYTGGMKYLHNHTHYEISVVVRGNLKVINNNDEIKCSGPCIILHFPGTYHCVQSSPDVCYERYNLNFRAEIFKRNPALLSDAEKLFISNISLLYPDDSELRELLYYLEPFMGDTACNLEKRERLLAVILSVLKSCRLGETTAKKRPASGCVNGAVVRLSEKISPLITANELAEELGVSRVKLTSEFKRETGMTLKEYIELQCVERAKSLLIAGSSVQETADQLGYVDVGTFIRVFKKVTGITPGKYGKNI